MEIISPQTASAVKAKLSWIRARVEPYRPWFPVTVFTTLLLYGAVWLVVAGPVNQEIFGADILVFIDGAWRVLQGQRPHLDFNSSIGFGVFWIYAAGFKLFGLNVFAIPPTIALVGMIAGTWTWFVGRARLSRWMAAASGLVAAAACYSPLFPDESAPLSYLGLYNKLDNALLIPILIDCLAREERAPGELTKAERRREILLGISTGGILAVYGVTKLTFLLPAFLAIIGGAFHFRRTRGWWVGLGGTLAAATIGTAIYLRGDLLAPMRDFLFVASARSSRVGELSSLPLTVQMKERGLAFGSGKVLEVLRLESEHLATMVISFIGVLYGTTISRRRVTWLAVILIMLGANIFVTASSFQWADIPLIAGVAVVVSDRARTLPRPTGAAFSYRVGVLLALLLSVHDMSRTALGIAYASTGREPGGRPSLPVTMMRGDAFDGFYIVKTGYCQPYRYGTRFNDGMALLETNTAPTDRLLVADFANPFSFALRRPSPRGDAVSWCARASFSRETHIPADVVLHDVDAIVIPKCPMEPETTAEMLYLYQPAFDAGYVKAKETEWWILMKKR